MKKGYAIRATMQDGTIMYFGSDWRECSLHPDISSEKVIKYNHHHIAKQDGEWFLSDDYIKRHEDKWHNHHNERHLELISKISKVDVEEYITP